MAPDVAGGIVLAARVGEHLHQRGMSGGGQRGLRHMARLAAINRKDGRNREAKSSEQGRSKQTEWAHGVTFHVQTMTIDAIAPIFNAKGATD